MSITRGAWCTTNIKRIRHPYPRWTLLTLKVKKIFNYYPSDRMSIAYVTGLQMVRARLSLNLGLRSPYLRIFAWRSLLVSPSPYSLAILNGFIKFDLWLLFLQTRRACIRLRILGKSRPHSILFHPLGRNTLLQLKS